MSIIYQERPSDSPFVQSISSVQALENVPVTIPAAGNWYLYAMRHEGKTSFTIGGPITQAYEIPQPVGAEWVGIRLKLGIFMPQLPIKKLVDVETTLPDATSKSFWLHGSAWEFPTHENVDTFIDRLVRDGLLVREPIVEAALQGHYLRDLSVRTIQRRFMHVIGMPQRAIEQIERAKQAAALLQQGVSILDTIEIAGYYDQPHLTKSLRRYLGQTPAQILRLNQSE